jgi:hypothetical protein
LEESHSSRGTVLLMKASKSSMPSLLAMVIVRKDIGEMEG